MKNTQFDLEQSIMDCWGVTDDLNVLMEAILEHDRLSKDTIANIVLGMKELYQLKFEKTYNLFEEYISENHRAVSNRVCEAVLPR